MATATAPIQVDAATEELVSHAAHFMSRSKKDIVDAAVREYIDAHRDEINAGIKAALGQLNGTDPAAVSLMTGSAPKSSTISAACRSRSTRSVRPSLRSRLRA